jgi:hypothetical protein
MTIPQDVAITGIPVFSVSDARQTGLGGGGPCVCLPDGASHRF